MSKDESVTKKLMQTLEDGNDGYTKGAEKLTALNETALVATFQQYAQQRKQFANELQGMAHAYGDDPERSGSVTAAVHRGWMSLKDALTKDTPKAVLDVAEQGDRHAIKEYKEALDDDISAGLRDVVRRQLTDITAARDDIASRARTYH